MASSNHPFQLFRARTSELGDRSPALKSAAGPEKQSVLTCVPTLNTAVKE
jgi:hypothetical protein